MQMEELQAELQKYKEIASEWLKAYRQFKVADTEEESQEALLQMDALRLENSWTYMYSPPALKSLTERYHQMAEEFQKQEDAINLLCLVWPNGVPIEELRKLLKEESLTEHPAQAKLNTLRVKIKLLVAYLNSEERSAGVKLAQTEKRLLELVENL